ncbi:MAG: hypothetical protein JWM37_921 [Candidatus Saccharibacteria bacterium]|nr:hypothetical protein [Candidatus Saccharibacteria bacterium]
MTWLYVFLACLAVFVLDAVWIGLAARRLYRAELGNMLRDKPLALPGMIFYPLYAAAVSLYVVWPAQSSAVIHDWMMVYSYGVGFGLAAYGTYALTNWAIFKRWSARVAVPDIIWGGFLTGLMGLAGSAVWLMAK